MAFRRRSGRRSRCRGLGYGWMAAELELVGGSGRLLEIVELGSLPLFFYFFLV